MKPVSNEIKDLISNALVIRSTENVERRLMGRLIHRCNLSFLVTSKPTTLLIIWILKVISLRKCTTCSSSYWKFWRKKRSRKDHKKRPIKLYEKRRRKLHNQRYKKPIGIDVENYIGNYVGNWDRKRRNFLCVFQRSS